MIQKKIQEKALELSENNKIKNKYKNNQNIQTIQHIDRQEKEVYIINRLYFTKNEERNSKL